MNRSILVAIVVLASFAAANAVVSLLVWVMWQHRQRLGLTVGSPAMRARRLVWLRACPTLVSLVVTLGVVLPAFAIHEPRRESEAVGPVIWVLAAVGAAQVLASLRLAVAAARRTGIVTRAWMQSGVPLKVDSPGSVPAFAVDTRSPIVALAGVFSPKLIVARSVLDACTREEWMQILAHERGHLEAQDNLKRRFVACAPDALRWTPAHEQMASAWYDAAEEAADDVASGDDAQARADLAALLVKIARLVPEPSSAPAAVSPFVDPGGLERRVRRLLAAGADAAAGPPTFLPVMVIAACALAPTALASPTTIEGLYHIVEAAIALWR